MPHDPVPDLLSAPPSCSKRICGSARIQTAARPKPTAMAQVLDDSRPPAGRQLPLLPSSLCRADAQAAASGGARRLRPGHEHQSQQPCSRRRPRQLGDGDRGRPRDRRDVRLDGIPGPPDLQRHAGQPRGALGCRATARPASASSAPSRRTTPTAASPPCSSCDSRPVPTDNRGRMRPGMLSRPSCAKAMWARWWSLWAPPPSAPSTRCTRFSRCGSGTASGSMSTRPTAATSR